MSASAPRSGAPPWTGLVRRAGGWLPVLSAVVCAWLVIGGVGCNGPLMFNTPRGSGGSGLSPGVGGGIAGVAGQNGGAGGDTTPPRPDAGPDRPADMGAPDTGVDVPVLPDVRPDVQVEVPPEVGPDRPPDVPPDLPRDLGQDVLPPGTCNVEADCHANLHCDVAAHTCQECVTSAHCAANATNKVCNTALTPNRCVECVDVNTCPVGMDHPSTCYTDNFRCGVGCDDNPNTCTGGLTCDTSTLDHICTECPTGSCAGSTKGPFCFGARVCVQCMNANDCAGTPGTPNCDLITGRCVRCRTSNDCAAPTPLCNPASFTCVP